MSGADEHRGLRRMFRRPWIVVLLAWGIVFVTLLSGNRILDAWFTRGDTITIPYLEYSIDANVYLTSLVLLLAAIATALALGIRNLLLGFLLASPGWLFMWLALFVAGFSKFVDVRPIFVAMLLFLISAIYGPFFIRSSKDEDMRRRIYAGALLLMALLATGGMLSLALAV